MQQLSRNHSTQSPVRDMLFDDDEMVAPTDVVEEGLRYFHDRQLAYEPDRGTQSRSHLPRGDDDSPDQRSDDENGRAALVSDDEAAPRGIRRKGNVLWFFREPETEI